MEDNSFGNIKSLGIYELRAVARSLGISSPTTKKREQLIDLIIEQLKLGKKIESNLPTKQGRPFKKLLNIDTILSSIKNSDYENQIKTIKSYEDVLEFHQKTPTIDNFPLNTSVKVKGVIRKFNDTFYFIDQSSSFPIYIEEITKFKKITEGDFVEGFALKISLNEHTYLNTLTKINNVNNDDYKMLYNDSQTSILPSTNNNLIFSENKIICGTRNLINFKISQDNIHIIKDFIKGFDENTICIILGNNLCFEDKFLLENIDNSIKFLGDYNLNQNVNFNKFIDTISLIERLEKQEKNIVLIVNDIMTIANTCDLFFDSEINQIYGNCNESILVVKKILGLAKYTNTGRSTTLISFYNDVDLNNKFFINEIYKVSNVLNLN